MSNQPHRSVKVFKASVPDDDDIPEPYEFSLEFLVVDDLGVPTGEVVAHDFTAAAQPGAGANFAASKVIRWDPDTGKMGTDLNGLIIFFDRVMSTEDLTRLKELFDDRHLSIDLGDVANVYTWLIEEYSGRPTPPSKRSSTGRRVTGPRSMAELSVAEAT